MARVAWSLTARRDFRKIVETAEGLEPRFALRIKAQIAQAVDNLESYPRIGRIVPRYQRDSLREVIFLQFRLIYRIVESNDVEIIALLDGRRDSPLTRPNEP